MENPHQFKLTARELLERHIAESNQPKQDRDVPSPARAPELEPARPQGNPAELAAERSGYSYGSIDAQQRAALRTNARLNADYFEHVGQQAQQRQEQRQDVGNARENLEQHIEKTQSTPRDRGEAEPTPAKEALDQHLQGAKREVTSPALDPLQRKPQGLER